MSDFEFNFKRSHLVREPNAGLYNTVTKDLVKIDDVVPYGRHYHKFIIKNKEKTKQKTIDQATYDLEIAYPAEVDSNGNITYQIFEYVFEVFEDQRKVSPKSMYLVWSDKLQNRLNDTTTEIVPTKGGARRKSKNVKRSRSKSRKSRKQRKSNKNRRTKYSKN